MAVKTDAESTQIIKDHPAMQPDIVITAKGTLASSH